MNEMNQQPQQQPQHQQLMNMNQNLMSLNRMNPHSQPQVIKFNHNTHFTPFPARLQSRDPVNFQPQMVPMNRNYGMWPQPQQFQKPNLSHGAMKPPQSSFNKSLGPRSNWKGKKVSKPNDKRRTEQQKSLMAGSSAGGIAGVNISAAAGGASGTLNFNNYNPPTLNELQHQNRLKTRKFFQKKKFNKNNNMNMNTNVGGHYGRSAPFAPRNTTSFLIRAKKSGGIAPLVSPYPVTPAVLPTPIFSPSREVLVDMAKEEWGVDGYGSMKGLIRLRSPGHEMETHEDDEEDEGGSSESDVEEHVEVERRLDHDLSRFEMIYDPSSNNVGGMEYHNVLENRVDDQDSHIAQLEEENLIFKEKLFLMETEVRELRRRMMRLERRGNRGEDANEEVVENESENESESRGEEGHSVDDNNDDSNEENIQGDKPTKGKIAELVVENDNKGLNAADENHAITDVEPAKGKIDGLEIENEEKGADENNAITDVEPAKEKIDELEIENEEKGANENNAITDVEHKEERNNSSYEHTVTNRLEGNTADMDEDRSVDVELK